LSGGVSFSSWLGGGRSVRTDQGGDENNGGEENVSLHVESFVREKKLLNYLCGVNLVIVCIIYKTENDVYLTTNKQL
jgi:hypothetical protein